MSDLEPDLHIKNKLSSCLNEFKRNFEYFSKKFLSRTGPQLIKLVSLLIDDKSGIPVIFHSKSDRVSIK